MNAYDYIRSTMWCSCPRQCRHLSYKRDVTQATFSKYMLSDLPNPKLTDEIRDNLCMVQVCRPLLGIHCSWYKIQDLIQDFGLMIDRTIENCTPLNWPASLCPSVCVRVCACEGAQPCVNGDRVSQWRMAKFDPTQIRNPSTDRRKIWNRW